MGIGLQVGQILRDLSQCEIWHVWTFCHLSFTVTSVSHSFSADQIMYTLFVPQMVPSAAASRCVEHLLLIRHHKLEHTSWINTVNEPQHDKTNKVSVRPAKTQISLGVCPVWWESSLSAWRKLGSLATHWLHSEIWVFTGRTVTLLVLSYRGSNAF